jgi:hypothetical protein
MAENIEIQWVKGPDWKLVSATGAAVGAIGGVGGFRVILRFSSEWANIEHEVISGESSADLTGTRTIIAAGASTFKIGELMKLEQIAVEMPPDGAAGLVTALLAQFAFYSAPQQQAIRDAFARTQAS